MSLLSRTTALMLAVLGTAQSQAAPVGALHGTAVNTSGAIVPDVEITIVDLGRATRTTGGGWFILDSIPAGVHHVRARRAGFQFVELDLEVAFNDVTYADFVMKPLATELAPVSVRGSATETHAADPRFADRMASGQGIYFTAADIEKHHPHRTTDMLRRISGLTILPNGEVYSGRGIVTLKTAACIHGMPVYVDGVQVGGGDMGDPASIMDDKLHRSAEWLSPTAASRSVIDGVKPETITGIEIYKGPATALASIPGTTSSCGAILIWTR
jgi:hypothetical protein